MTHLISQRWRKPVVKTTKIWCWPRFLMCTHLCHVPWHRSEIMNDPSVGQATCSKTGRGHGCNSPVLITPCFVNTLGKNAPRIFSLFRDKRILGNEWVSVWIKCLLKIILLLKSSLKLHIYFWESLSCSDNFVSLGLTRFVWRFSRMIVSIVSIVWPSFSVRRMSHHLSNR